MIKYIKKLFKLPTNFKEQKINDSRGLKIVSFCFFITTILFIAILSKNWNSGAYSNKKVLFYISLLNTIGHALTFFVSYQLFKNANNATAMSDLRKIKISSYYVFGLLVGIPYMLMSAWLFFNQDYSEMALLLVIYFMASLVIYFYDWKTFLKNSISFDMK